MGCRVCEGDDGELVRVEYTDGNAEEITLCNDCREGFTDGDLVEEVVTSNSPDTRTDD